LVIDHPQNLFLIQPADVMASAKAVFDGLRLHPNLGFQGLPAKDGRDCMLSDFDFFVDSPPGPLA
jgi:hypothetical protein